MNLNKKVLALTSQVNAVQAKILKELLADGRKTYNEIAKSTGISKEIIKKNYNNMEENGIITGATTHINYKSFGFKAVVHILITVDTQQADQLTEYLQKMPEVYSFYSRGVKGNIDVVATLKTLEQLNEIKDAIKKHFSIIEMKSAIWTDVKETNDNLAIIDENRKNLVEHVHPRTKIQEKNNSQAITIDEIDQKIVDQLSKNGRLSTRTLGKVVGVSPEAARKRYERLKKNGILKITIQINPIKLGYQALCVFFTSTSNENSLSIIKKINKIPDIISIMKTSGDYDLQIWAMIQDIEQLLSIEEELGKIPGIQRIDMEVLRVLGNWPTPRQHISTF